MNASLLWCDTTSAGLAAKIERGAAHYEAKHGRRPTRVTVHPSEILAAGGYPQVAGIQVGASRRVEPSYFLFAACAPEPEPLEAA